MEPILAGVQDAFHQAFGVDPQLISMSTTPADVPPWDSVGHLDLVSHIERVFRIRFSVDDLMEMENVREIVRIVGSKTPA